MRGTLSQLRERAPQFARHIVSQSLYRGPALTGQALDELEARSVMLVERLIDWLALEEGHADEWWSYVGFVGALDELCGAYGERLTLPSLLRLFIQLERHLLSLDKPTVRVERTLKSSAEGAQVAWRRRLLAAYERALRLCELRALLERGAEDERAIESAERLKRLAFAEGRAQLYEPLLTQLESRAHSGSALSPQHLYTLCSAHGSWWRVSLGGLFEERGVELIHASARVDEPWEALRALASGLLRVAERRGGPPSVERQLLSCWAAPLEAHERALSWLEELSPRSRRAWLERALRSVMYELSVELDVRLCFWVSEASALSPLEVEALTYLLQPDLKGRRCPLIMITQHSPHEALPQAITALEPTLRSPLPCLSVDGLIGFEAEPLHDPAAEWERAWLLALSGQLRIDAEGQSRAQPELMGLSQALGLNSEQALLQGLWGALYAQRSERERQALNMSVLSWGLLDPRLEERSQASAERGLSLGSPSPWLPFEQLFERLQGGRRGEGAMSAARRALATPLREELAQRYLRDERWLSSPHRGARLARGMGGPLEQRSSWERAAEALNEWWGLSEPRQRPDPRDQLKIASRALLEGDYERAEQRLASALSRGERGGAYWRSIRLSFGLLCCLRAEQDEAQLFIDEALGQEQDERWSARLQARALLLKGMSSAARGAERESVIALSGAARVAAAIGELSLEAITSQQLAQAALRSGERVAGLKLLEQSLKAAREGGLEPLSARLSLELSLWSLSYGARSRARAYLKRCDRLKSELALHLRLANGLCLIGDMMWAEALGELAPLLAEGEQLRAEGGDVQAEAALLSALSMIEADRSTASLMRAQGLAREVRLRATTSRGLSLFARYVELRVARQQPQAEDERARELRSRHHELREAWGEGCDHGTLTLSEALLYTLSGVEVGVAMGSLMEALTELESLKPYVARARGELMGLGWPDQLTQRWELQRLCAILPKRGREAPWLLGPDGEPSSR